MYYLGQYISLFYLPLIIHTMYLCLPYFLLSLICISLSIFSGCQYKEVCWRLDRRGGVGETPLHLCLLNATSIHADLAKRLLRIYPKLIVDIYISDDFYGECMEADLLFWAFHSILALEHVQVW